MKPVAASPILPQEENTSSTPMPGMALAATDLTASADIIPDFRVYLAAEGKHTSGRHMESTAQFRSKDAPLEHADVPNVPGSILVPFPIPPPIEAIATAEPTAPETNSLSMSEPISLATLPAAQISTASQKKIGAAVSPSLQVSVRAATMLTHVDPMRSASVAIGCEARPLDDSATVSSARLLSRLEASNGQSPPVSTVATQVAEQPLLPSVLAPQPIFVATTAATPISTTIPRESAGASPLATAVPTPSSALLPTVEPALLPALPSLGKDARAQVLDTGSPSTRRQPAADPNGPSLAASRPGVTPAVPLPFTNEAATTGALAPSSALDTLALPVPPGPALASGSAIPNTMGLAPSTDASRPAIESASVGADRAGYRPAPSPSLPTPSLPTGKEADRAANVGRETMSKHEGAHIDVAQTDTSVLGGRSESNSRGSESNSRGDGRAQVAGKVSKDSNGQPANGSPAPPLAHSGSAAALVEGDKSLTPVNRMSADGTTGRGSADGTSVHSAQSAMNQVVLRHAAQGEIDHPELGRVAVMAKMRDGEVDVRLTAQRVETAAILAPRVDAMVADARAAQVPVARIDVGSGGSAAHSFSASRDGRPNSHEHGDRPTSERDQDEAAPPPPRRVRIVL